MSKVFWHRSKSGRGNITLTPIEIFEYKKKWQREGGYSVRLHSDIRSKGKDFCKALLAPHHWDFSEYTNVYEDTFLFKNKKDADKFSEQWPEFVDQ